MSGTKAGGKRAAATNKARHGSDYYKRIGSIGGKLGRTGGFAANPELARIAGKKGGRISRRPKKIPTAPPRDTSLDHDVAETAKAA